MITIQPDTTLPKIPAVKLYTGKIWQYGTDAPFCDALHNTYESEPIFTRTNVGAYTMTFEDILTGHTTIILSNNMQNAGRILAQNFTNTIEINTADNTFTPADDILRDCTIEVKTYKY